MSQLKIGILGTGDVGRVLGAAFARLGHDVKIGSRDAQSDKVRAWVDKTGPRASSGTFAEAARFGDLLIPDEAALEKLLDGTNRVWVIGYSGTHEHLQQLHGKALPLVKRVGQFELFSN